MKRSTIISLTIVAYFVAMVVMLVGVQKYIENKDNKLRIEIHDKIDEIFALQRRFVDIAYSGSLLSTKNCRRLKIK